MSSTRNRNQPYDYACKKKENMKIKEYRMSPFFHEPKNASHSFVLGANPSKLNHNTLSYNAVDIESTLRGIRSNNLEGETFHAVLKPKNYYTVEIFENNLSKDNVFIPRPFDYNPNERKGFHNI